MRSVTKDLSLALFLVLLSASSALAHHPSGGAGLGQAEPIRTLSAGTLPAGTIALAAQVESIELDEFSDAELLHIAEGGSNAHSVDTIFHSIFSVGYGLTDDLTVSLKLPHEELGTIREVHSDEPGEIHLHGDAKGLGDLTVMGLYRFLKSAEQFETSLVVGLKMPTGETDDLDLQGERFEAEFQPGSGAWSPSVGIAATKKIDRFSLDADLQYAFGTTGTQETDLGDICNYNAALSYRAIAGPVSWDFILEANGESKSKQEIRGEKDPDSGGHALFLSPGTRIMFGKTASTYLSFALPVLQDLNGIQDDTGYKVLFGMSFLLH